MAAVLAVLGGFGHAGLAFFYLLVAAPLPGGDRAEMVAYVERLNASPVLGLVAMPLIMSFGLAVIAMGWAAWRVGLVGWWGPVAATAGVLIHFALPVTIPAVEVAALAVLAVVFGYLGVRIARMTDREWDGSRTPAPAPVPVHV